MGGDGARVQRGEVEVHVLVVPDALDEGVRYVRAVECLDGGGVALDPLGDGLVEDAAAVVEAFVTAHDAIVTQAQLRSGEPLVIHAIGSGVGTAAAQLGRALGAFVIGTELKLTVALVLIVGVLTVKPAGLFGKTIVQRV